MGPSSSYGFSPNPKWMCRVYLVKVKVVHRVTTRGPGGAVIDTPPTTPQVTTPQALLAKEKAALLLLRPTTAAFWSLASDH